MPYAYPPRSPPLSVATAPHPGPEALALDFAGVALCPSPATALSCSYQSSHVLPASPRDSPLDSGPAFLSSPLEIACHGLDYDDEDDRAPLLGPGAGPAEDGLPPSSSPGTRARRLFPHATRSVFLGTSRAASIRAALAFRPRRRACTVDDALPLRAVQHSPGPAPDGISKTHVHAHSDGGMRAESPHTWRAFGLRRHATLPVFVFGAVPEEAVAPGPGPAGGFRGTDQRPRKARTSNSSWGDQFRLRESISPAAFGAATGAEELAELDEPVREALYVNAALRARGLAYEPVVPPASARTDDSEHVSANLGVRRKYPVRVSSLGQLVNHDIAALHVALEEVLTETSQITSTPSLQASAPRPQSQSRALPTPPLKLVTGSKSRQNVTPLRAARSVPNFRSV
ncbi:hypothetical protein MIND_01165600 [Mycena indigotica]|uniref:Uncharacterized protein n=1 Tax=Mycena indigotica TaxID=2126181 RepID=A0A8H6VYC7_9AGAR|nr:uncharacterized protein MIND_01165600 [Mycena indigotica]KAF7292674.1 hypothetical protein MIND_01165600 [Mycena indigotica]